MRKRLVKNNTGISSQTSKEVAISVIKAGFNSQKQQRYSVSFRFTENAQKKATSSGYVAVEVDDEYNRLYFITADPKDGYKLYSERNRAHSFAITVKYLDDWKKLVGDYYLKKDVSDGTYYIDLPSCPRV